MTMICIQFGNRHAYTSFTLKLWLGED